MLSAYVVYTTRPCFQGDGEFLGRDGIYTEDATWSVYILPDSLYGWFLTRDEDLQRT